MRTASDGAATVHGGGKDLFVTVEVVPDARAVGAEKAERDLDKHHFDPVKGGGRGVSS